MNLDKGNKWSSAFYFPQNGVRKNIMSCSDSIYCRVRYFLQQINKKNGINNVFSWRDNEKSRVDRRHVRVDIVHNVVAPM